MPVLLASGWSGLLLYLTGVPLNPMSVTLSILVVAIATEISVLLAERYRQERMAGAIRSRRCAVTYARPGAAVAASVVTAIAGFGVLALSEVRMLRDFGLVTILDLGVALVGVLLALPSVVLLLAPTHPQLVVSEPAATRLARWRGGRRSRARGKARARARAPRCLRTPSGRASVARTRRSAAVSTRARRRFVGARRGAGRAGGDRASWLPARPRAACAASRPARAMPPFAVPLALGDLSGDPNIATAAGQGDRGQPARVHGARRRASSTSASSTNSAPVVLGALRASAARARACASELQSLRRVLSRCGLRRCRDQGGTRAGAQA